MLIELSVTCAIGAVIAREVQRRRGIRRDGQRRQHLMIQALRQTDTDQRAFKRPHRSVTGAEMERLLSQLRAAADILVDALAQEDASGPGDQWSAARLAVSQAQEVYDQAVCEYREFVQGLPVPLRAKAAERGIAAMTAIHT
jgi:hypothetical protein